MSKNPDGNSVRHDDFRKFEDFRKTNEGERGGILRLAGKYLSDHKDEILNLIKHEETLAMERDPKTSVKVVKNNGGVEVEMNSDILAMRIGKAILHAHHGEHSYKFRKGDRYVEVDWKRD